MKNMKDKKNIMNSEWWTKPNPEGISNKDVLQVISSWVAIQSVLIGAYLYILNYI